MIQEALYDHEVTRAGAKLSRVELFDGPTGDLFAGWGGFTLAHEMATGRTVDFCVNHSPAAIEYHARNHPHSRHFICDVFELEPHDVTNRWLELLTGSPDCTHFSPARGAAPVSESVRSLAWVLIKYAGCKIARPKIIIVENVPAFVKWGPIYHAKNPDGSLKFDKKGRPWMLPIPGREGEEFAKWEKAYHDLGYKTDWRVLDAADYGVPQHRERFFHIARCDGQPIVWPEPTHGPKGSGLLPYRTAAECIDFSLPCPTIFMTEAEGKAFKKATGIAVQRPLAENTLSRAAMGTFRFVLDNDEPFIVDTNHAGEGFRGQSIHDPMGTVSGAHGQAVITPYSVTVGYGEREGQEPRCRPLIEPSTTVVGRGIKQTVVEPVCIGVGGSAYAGKPRRATRPAGTVKCDDRRGVTVHWVAQFNTNPDGTVNAGHDLRDPSSTVACRGPHQGVGAASVMKFRGDSSGQRANQPSPTVTSGAGAVRPAGAPHALGVNMAFVAKFRGTSQHGASIDQPGPSITGGGQHESIACLSLLRFNQEKAGENNAHEVAAPIGTVPTENRWGLNCAVLVRYHGSGGQWSDPADPCSTITGMEGKAVLQAHVEQTGDVWPVEVLDRAQQVAKFMRKYVGRRFERELKAAKAEVRAGKKRAIRKVEKLERNIAKLESHLAPLMVETPEGLRKVGELVLLTVRGALHVMVDIGLRMFTPRELARCQGFPDSYVLPKSKNVAVKLIGNSVPPPLAAALIKANCPHLCRPQRRHRRRAPVAAV